MIKFFRRIRQKLLAENRFSKYLLYALGEIILVVVIGILIALQINNWNEKKKQKNLERSLLIEIASNLDTDFKNLNLKIEENNKYLKSNTFVLKHLKDDLPLTKELKFHYSFLYGHGNFQPNIVGFENLKSIGIDLVRNKDLRKELAQLYSYEYYSFVEDRRGVVKEYQIQQSEEINQNIKINVARESAEPMNIVELRKNIQFQNTLITNIALLNWVNDKYEKGKIAIDQVKQQIEMELED